MGFAYQYTYMEVRWQFSRTNCT